MSEQDNIQIVRRFIDNLNKHNLTANDPYVANDVKTEATAASGVLTNREQGRMYIQLFLDAFPDLRFDIKDIIAQGNKVVVSWVSKGTHNGLLKTASGDSIPATGKKVMVPGCTIYEFRNEMVTRQEIYWDQITLLIQLEVPLGMLQTSRPSR